MSCREAIIEILKARFESVPELIVTAVSILDNLSLLDNLLKEAAIITSLDEFQKILERKEQIF